MVDFRVLRCAHCQTFQVLQVTKSPKWKCKLCGEKQSVLKEYGRGSGADCRHHVQKLNSLRMEIDTTTENITLDSACNGQSSSDSCSMINAVQGEGIIKQKKTSHWETFLEKDDSDESEGLETVKDEAGAHFPRGGINQEKVIVTTEWSTFENERRQTWKNKRKMHDRSNWKKSAKYEDVEDDICSDGDKNNRKRTSWKQSRVPLSGLVDHGLKESDSQNKRMSCGDIWLNKSSVKYGASETNFTSYNSVKEVTSQKCTQYPVNGTDFDFDSRQNQIFKHKIDLPSQSLTTVETSVMRKKCNASNIPRKSVEATVKPSKWSGFITEKSEDNSNDSSDDEDNNQRTGNIQIVGDSFRAASIQGFDNRISMLNSPSRGNKFAFENDSDDSVKFDEDEDNHHVIESYNENFYVNEKLNPNASNDLLAPGNNIFIDKGKSACFDSSSQSFKKGNNIIEMKSVVHSTITGTNYTGRLTQSQGRGGENKSSLFEIGDDDNDVWDLDL